MKNTVILIITMALCLLFTESKAQRRLPGQCGIQLTGGLADGYVFCRNKKIAFFTSVGLSRYTQNAHKWLFGAEYFEKRYCYKCRSIPLSQITLEAGYYYKFWSDRGRNVFLSLGLSGLGGYETINWGKKNMIDGAYLVNKDHLIAGAALTLEAEAFLLDNLIFIINLRERALNSNVGIFHTQVGFGLKYIYK